MKPQSSRAAGRKPQETHIVVQHNRDNDFVHRNGSLQLSDAVEAHEVVFVYESHEFGRVADTLEDLVSPHHGAVGLEIQEVCIQTMGIRQRSGKTPICYAQARRLPPGSAQC